MLVISDTSPVSALVRIGRIEPLPHLFKQVIIPPQVRDELMHPKAPDVVRAFIARPPEWLAVEAPEHLEPIPHLDRGEVAAISLARELAGLLLIDDKDGRRAAVQRGIAITGTIGIVERAAADRLVRADDILASLLSSGFFIESSVVDAVVERCKKIGFP